MIAKEPMIISFSGGSGGNWLKQTIQQQPLKNKQSHFHNHKVGTSCQQIYLIHETDVSKFDYLLSGSHYFNFFINVIYKHFFLDSQFHQVRSYKDYYTECVNTARYLCSFEKIKNSIYFNFDNLIYNDIQFYNCIVNACPMTTLSIDDFIQRKNAFFNTQVETQDIFENFDSPIWVSFVLGQLMNHNIVPTDFSIYEKANQKLSAEFAKKHYEHCQLTKVHHFNSGVILPEFL